MSERVGYFIGSFHPKNIVLATDFFESSRLALDYAVALSHHFGSTLTIMHAFELPYEAEEAELIGRRPSVSRKVALARLEAFATGVRRLGITVNLDLRDGDPCTTVLKSAAENHCDLLVIGTHGIYRGVHHLVIGSNAEKILHATHCPTLTVGRHVLGGIDLDFTIEDILVISDPTLGNINPAILALQLGEEFGAPVELLHLSTSDQDSDRVLGDGLALRCGNVPAPFASRVNPDWRSSRFHCDRMFSAEDIIRRAETSRNSLIVAGVHSLSRIDRHLHSSFAFELAARAASPLLSVPSAAIEP